MFDLPFFAAFVFSDIFARVVTAMKYKGFEAAIEYDHDIRLPYGQILGLHETVGHAAVDDYLHDPLNEPSTRLTIDIPGSLHERFKAKTASRGEGFLVSEHYACSLLPRPFIALHSLA